MQVSASLQYLVQKIANLEVAFALLLEEKAAIERERDELRAKSTAESGAPADT